MDAAAKLRSPLAQLARTALLTGVAGYAALAISLLARRIAGVLSPLDALLLLWLAVSVPAAILLVHGLWPPTRERRRASDWFVRIAPAASALLLAAAVSLRGTSPPALAALWLAIVGVEAATVSHELRRRARRRRRERMPLSPRTTQSLVRKIDTDGAETVTGELRASFRPSERTVFLHVAFCPPLASAPTIECEQLAGPEALVKVTQRQTFGARFEVRLARETSASADVQVQFVARCPHPGN